MRLVACVVPTFLLLAACGSAYSQQKLKTDVQRDDLLGPVKAVAGARVYSAPAEQQNKVRLWVVPGCAICEYDANGNKIAEGQTVDGKFVGERITVLEEASGRVERISASMPAAQMKREVAGPYGKTELTVTSGDNVITHQTFAYDQNGHLADWESFDAGGESTGHMIYRSTAQGDNTLRASYDKDNNLMWRETWDPETDESRFVTYDPGGAPQVTWTIAHGKILSFWEATEKPGQFGEVLWEDLSDRDATWFHCNKAAGCTTETEHRVYLGPGKHNIQSREWRDSENNVEWSAQYEYELDSHGNWTDRKVWLTLPGESSRTLFAEDARVISYWDE